MTASALITLRETLETSLVVGIVLTYLDRTDNRSFRPSVWLGLATGIALSLVVGILLHRFFGGLEGRMEQLFEGTLLLLAVALMSWMIFWMMRAGRTMRQAVERDVSMHVLRECKWGVFLLILFTVLREGTETVIFLQAALLQSGLGLQLIGAALGMLTAIVISLLIFWEIRHIPLKRFFGVMNVLLILFSAGLFMHGIHEFQEAGFLPKTIEHLWNTSAILPQGSFVGGILRQLFGYTEAPSLLEVMAYGAYLMLAAALWYRLERRRT